MSTPESTDASPRCGLCSRPILADELKNLTTASGERFYLCARDHQAFTLGRSLGQSEIESYVFQRLHYIDDDLTGAELKDQIAELQLRPVLSGASKAASCGSPRDIVTFLDRSVIGQATAKRKLALSVYEHQRATVGGDLGTTVQKSNILLIGPSGSGKTLLARTLACASNLPFTHEDATAFSPAGWRGSDIDSIVHNLYFGADENTTLTERGMVFLDEIDKIVSATKDTEDLTRNTQHGLLKLIEGKTVMVPINGVLQELPPVPVKTDNILFVLGGAFTGLPEIVAKLMGRDERRIGLRAAPMERAAATHELLSLADTDTMTRAMIEFGMTAEMVGRLPVVVALAPLTREQLHACLELPSEAMAQQKALFLACGYALEFEQETLEQIVDTAHKMATGTRALNAQVRHAVNEAAYALLGDACQKSRGRVVIDRVCLSDPSAYRLASASRRQVRTSQASKTEFVGAK